MTIIKDKGFERKSSGRNNANRLEKIKRNKKLGIYQRYLEKEEDKVKI